MQVAITGNTYPVKDALKSLGAKWNADEKAWMISSAKADEARKIVEGAPEQKATPGICLKCKGPVKAPYTVCYGCKNGVSTNRRSGIRYGFRSRREACPNCGSTSCSKAYDGHDLCDED